MATDRVADRPGYARSLNQAAEDYGMDALKSDVDWLDYGIESRTRYEHRWHDYTTPTLVTDDALVTRNLVYFGIKHVLDPLRLVVELEDARRPMSDRPETTNVADKMDFLQAYAELYFDNVLDGEALSLSFGRMSFDSVDRRLIERTRNRNAMTAFDGLRLRLGDEKSPWEIEGIAVRPVERNIEDIDKSSADLALYGVTGYFRGLSPTLVLEPYWLWLDQQNRDVALRRNIHTVGLHAYGQWGQGSAWDYDLSVAGQWGTVKNLDHNAYAAHVEAGYTWASAWKPRLALWLNYASGDRSPKDGSDQRFDPLYGDTYAFYGFSGYFNWQNMINPALRLSFQPAEKVRVELYHRAIWLASDTDAWVRAARRDSTGNSGNFIGQESDLRVIYEVCKAVELDLAYAHFFPGSFTNKTGAALPSDFLQIAATIRF